MALAKKIAYVSTLAMAALMMFPAFVQAETGSSNSDAVCDAVTHYHYEVIVVGVEAVQCHDAEHNLCGGGTWIDVDGDGSADGDEATEWFVFCKSRNDG